MNNGGSGKNSATNNQTAEYLVDMNQSPDSLATNKGNNSFFSMDKSISSSDDVQQVCLFIFISFHFLCNSLFVCFSKFNSNLFNLQYKQTKTVDKFITNIICVYLKSISYHPHSIYILVLNIFIFIDFNHYAN